MEVRLNDERMIVFVNPVSFSMIGRTADNSGISFVDLDHTLAVEDAFQYLVNEGHHRIVYLDYPTDLAETRYAQQFLRNRLSKCNLRA